ncbi:hypothetical protein AVEN_8871-1 [Araneus ventricosus]|uniref:DUF4817 domain-containing protein n=1 Tax=Araneus ventricosus TaxID=182803 RepID=A0A4Y2HEQ4_ARAVE|nr:hypothetical protein AVEN_8871-1 [Araneus ventricosus]
MASVQQNARLGRLCSHGRKSNVPAQRRFRLEYRNCQSRSKKSINRWTIDRNNSWYEQFKGIGNVPHRNGAGRPSVSDEVVERGRETSFLNCSYQRLMEFLPGNRQYRSSNRKHIICVCYN